MSLAAHEVLRFDSAKEESIDVITFFDLIFITKKKTGIFWENITG